MTPVAWMFWNGAVQEADTSLAVARQYNCDDKPITPLYSDAQLQQARADALREAAENVSVWLDLHSRERYLVRDGLRSMAAEIEGEKK